MPVEKGFQQTLYRISPSTFLSSEPRNRLTASPNFKSAAFRNGGFEGATRPQSGTTCLNSSKKFWTRMRRAASYSPPAASHR